MPDPVSTPEHVSQPAVSVMVPLFSHLTQCRYVEPCLRSILSQTYANLEVTVLDAAMDGSSEIAESVAKGDPRMTVIRAGGEHGPVAMLCELMSRATGEYLAYVLPFDRLNPRSIARKALALAAVKEISLVTSTRVAIDDEGRYLPSPGEMTPLAPTDTVLEGRALGDLALKMGVNVIGELSALMFRRGVLEPDSAFSAGGKKFHAVADMALILRLLATGPAMFLAQPLAEIRTSADRVRPGASRFRPLLEWIHLAGAARHLAYLQEPEAEPTVLAMLAGRIFECGMRGEDLGDDGLAGTFITYGRSLARLREHLTTAHVSMIFSPHIPLPDSLVDTFAGSGDYKVELVSVEEVDAPPTFTPTAAMISITVADVSPGSGHEEVWNAGAQAAKGTHLVAVAEPETLCLGAIAAAVRELDENPLVGAVRCDAREAVVGGLPPDSAEAAEGARRVVALVVRAGAWKETGGIPVDGAHQDPRWILSSFFDEIAGWGYEVRTVDAGTADDITSEGADNVTDGGLRTAEKGTRR